MNLKKSKQLKNQLLEQLKRTPIVEAACHKAGISRQTFYRWKAEDAEFAKEIDKAVADGQMLVNDLSREPAHWRSQRPQLSGDNVLAQAPSPELQDEDSDRGLAPNAAGRIDG